jgi:hypothetical protein
MAKSHLITAAILAASLTTPAHGSDGKNLQKSCKLEPYGYCLGFVAGVYAATSEPFCNPPSVKDRELRSIVVKYMNDHPEKLHLGQAELVVEAYKAAFPCKDGE